MKPGLLASVSVHSPLMMKEAADAEAENGNRCCDSDHQTEEISRDGPAGEKADQSARQTEDGNLLVELLLLRVFKHIGGARLLQQRAAQLDDGIISEN